jgi:uncharacterized protein YecT (DUF1311 family)
MRLILALTALAATSGLAFADDGDISECDGATPVMTKCIWDHYDAADKELNQVWRQALATIQPSDYLPPEEATKWKEELTAAQKAWVTFKERDCNGAVAYEWYGGTGANGAVGTCLFEHTVARTTDLKARYLER